MTAKPEFFQQSENKTCATWEGGGGLPQPARIFRIYFLLKEFSPLSWSLEQAKLKWEVKNVKLKMKNGTGEGLNFLELSSVTGFSLRIPLAVLQ